jgi:hypothetical protein
MYEGALLTTPSNGGDGFHDYVLVAQRHIESQAPPSQRAAAVTRVNLSHLLRITKAYSYLIW